MRKELTLAQESSIEGITYTQKLAGAVTQDYAIIQGQWLEYRILPEVIRVA